MRDNQIDFDRIENRRNTNSLKWDVSANELPMWVADMDFRTAPAVIEALNKKVQEGIFGYAVVPDSWYEAIQHWWQKRHNFAIEKDWLAFATGIVPTISSAVKRITNLGDQVLVQTPVYNIFFNSIENGGRHVLENKLKYDKDGYHIDFEDLEEKLAHPLTTMMILCNPHNPVGKIWTKEELDRIGRLCKEHHVTVLSDEIHCDLTEPGNNYIPFASVSDVCAENSITCVSASKAFNLAGLQSSAVIIPNEALRQKIVRGLNSDEIAEPNSFATEAVVAAFTKGEFWLDELRKYIASNKRLVAEFLEKENPSLKLVDSTATYLLWLDCKEVAWNTTELCQFIRQKNGLYLTAGNQYRGNGEQFIRMNIACAESQVKEGLLRLKQGVEAYEEMVAKRC